MTAAVIIASNVVKIRARSMTSSAGVVALDETANRAGDLEHAQHGLAWRDDADMRVTVPDVQERTQSGGVEEGDSTEIDLERATVEACEPPLDQFRSREVALTSQCGATIEDHHVDKRFGHLTPNRIEQSRLGLPSQPRRRTHYRPTTPLLLSNKTPPMIYTTAG